MEDVIDWGWLGNVETVTLVSGKETPFMNDALCILEIWGRRFVFVCF